MASKQGDDASRGVAAGGGRRRSSGAAGGAVATFKLTPPLEVELDKAGQDGGVDGERLGSGGRPHRRRSHSFGKDDDLISQSGSETGGDHRKKQNTDDSTSFFTALEELTDRVRLIAPTLSSIPELSLDEASHVRQCFAELMGERENITNALELRVLLGNLGFYPPERELELLLKAYRYRVNLSGLIRFLRFYKKNYPTYEGPDRSRYRMLLQNNATHGGGDVFSQLSAPPSGMNDQDAIRAFIALGGEEDGSGVVEMERLQEALQEFGVAVEFPEELVDKGLDFVDFCNLWEHRPTSADDHRCGLPGLFPLSTTALNENSISSFSQLNPQTPGPPSLLLSRRLSHLPRRLLSMLEGAVAGGPAMTPTASARASQQVRVSLRSGCSSVQPSFQGGMRRGVPALSMGYAFGGGYAQDGKPSMPGALYGAHGRESEGPQEGDGGAMAPSYGRRGSHLVGGGGPGGGGGGRAGSFNGGKEEPPLQQRLLTEPISHEEHAQLLCLYLFPERYEGRKTHFNLPDKSSGGGNKGLFPYVSAGSAGRTMSSGGGGGGMGGTGGSGSGGGTAAGQAAGSGNGGGGYRRDGAAAGRIGGAGRSRRPRSKGRGPVLGWKTSTYGQKKEEESDEEDFFSQKNGGAYRPPSPTILSLRHSTAYKRYQRNQQQQQQQQKLLSEREALQKKKKEKGPGGEVHFNSTGTSGSNDVGYGSN